MKTVLSALAGLAAAFAAIPAMAQEEASVQKALTIISSASAETQFMALVLAGAVMERGAETTVMLCDGAGDLAIKDEASIVNEIAIAPPNKTPRALLRGLQAKGATVEVCAIYLPNRPLDRSDLAEGIGVATPPGMSALMADPAVRVFTF